tara:strand:- start:760 stop:1281 length:522 start_codon:yes stop_codon:yes gene_type:complete
MDLDFNQFINLFDILFLSIVLISIFFGVKNGLSKSLLNLIKWIIIFLAIKNCFNFLRPFFDQYITNQTLSDILIFFSTLIVIYIFMTFLNRIIIGIVQPKKSLFIDISFGGILGLFRGYIIFIIMIFFINTNFSLKSVPEFLENGTFQEIVNYGVDFLKQMPRNIDDIQNINI